MKPLGDGFIKLARWDGPLDLAHARRVLAGNPLAPIATTPETVATVD